MGETRNCFYRFISDNYENIKRNLKKGLTTYIFDEDIYHDTLLKCMLLNIDLTDKEMYNYIFIAFKTNLNREANYHRNTMTDRMDDNDTETFFYSQDFVSLMDYNGLLSCLHRHFKDTDVQCFEKWVHGHPIREIEESFHVSGMTYRINLIRKYISDKKLLSNYLS